MFQENMKLPPAKRLEVEQRKIYTCIFQDERIIFTLEKARKRENANQHPPTSRQLCEQLNFAERAKDARKK